jgi:hypothetical protein
MSSIGGGDGGRGRNECGVVERGEESGRERYDDEGVR